MLARRVITAAVGLPVVIALVLIGGAAYAVAVGAVLVIASLEFFAATDPERRLDPAATTRPPWRPRLPAIFGAAGAALLVLAADNGYDYFTGALAGIVAGAFLLLVLRGDPRTGLPDWVWVVSGAAYVGFLGAHLVPLRDLDDDGDWLLIALIGTFAADTMAFFVGRTIGRTKIAPAISPGKTLEGTLGGLAGGAAAVVAMNWITGLDAEPEDIIPLALIVPLGAMIGDLAESLIKRGAGVKDASELVPGHGGFLDRLDSILFVTPLVYYFVIWAVL